MVGGRDEPSAPSPSPSLDSVSRLEWDIEFPPGHAAAYLIEGPEPILIDAGNPGDDGREQLEANLADVGYEPGGIAHLLVTHPHTDHTGQVPTLLDAGATLSIAAMARDQLARDADDLADGVRETATLVGLPEDLVPRFVEGAVDSLERNRGLVPPDAVDTAFGLAEPFEVGGRTFRPIHAPGHQRAQTVLLTEIEGQSVLFSGDALIEPFRPAALHAGLDLEAFEAIEGFYAGLDRLRGRDVGVVYPGHGPVFDAYERVIEATADDLDDLVGTVTETLRSVEPATPNEVTIERVGIPDHPAPMLDTIGVLGLLESEGRASFTVGDDGARRYRTVE